MHMGQCALTLRARAKAAGALRQKSSAKCSFPPCSNKAVAGGSICQECSDVLWMQRAGFGDRHRRQTTSPDDIVVTKSPLRQRVNDDNFEQQDMQGAIPRNFRHLHPPPPPHDTAPLRRSDATRSRHVNALPTARSARLQRRDEQNINYELRLHDYMTEEPTHHNRHDIQRRTEVSRQYTLDWLDSHETHGHDDDPLPFDEHHDEGPSSSLQVSGVTTSLRLDDE